MKEILFICLFLAFSRLWAQTPDPQVINSAGGTRTAANGSSITDNVGEPFTQALAPLGSLMLTQGYLQPLIISPGFSITLAKSDVTCSDKNDGSISVEIRSVYTQTAATYAWAPAVCANNCSSIDSLAPGNYSVAVKITYTTASGSVRRDSSLQAVTIADAGSPCLIRIYTGLVAGNNGDGGKWKIGNIDEFPMNKVSIFNRWGAEVFSAAGYDNITKVWSADNKLPASTYFYIIDLGNGSKPYKGWVELIKNQ